MVRDFAPAGRQAEFPLARLALRTQSKFLPRRSPPHALRQPRPRRRLHRSLSATAGTTHPVGPAPLQRLCALGAARGIARFVIVQPSFYGTDNRLLLESLDALESRGRGVAVVDLAAVTQATLADYAARGVRGVRLNLYSPVGNVDRGRMAAAFAAAADLAAPLGWHVEVIAAIDIVAAHAELLGRSAVPVVIDHYGVYGHHGPTGAAGKALLDLARRPHVWMKLSAPYRVSDDPLATKPDPAWLAAFLDAGGIAACGAATGRTRRNTAPAAALRPATGRSSMRPWWTISSPRSARPHWPT